MSALAETLRPLALAAAIEFVGAVGIAAYCAAALWAASRGRGPARAQSLVIEGALWGLGFKTAATLLKAVESQSWHGVASFAVILALWTALKRVTMWEQGRLDARRRGGVSPPG